MAQMQDHRNDADLVGAVRAAHQEAYAVLVDRHLSKVYSLVARMVCNTADAEDVTQEVFLRAFQRLHLYDPRCSFRNWLLRIATNLSLNHLRSRRRKRVVQRPDVEGQGHARCGRDPPAEVPSPREWQYWFSQLDQSQRAAIVLFHFSGMRYTEIAEVLNVPLNTVKTLLHRGRKRLRGLMATGMAPENRSWNVTIQNG